MKRYILACLWLGLAIGSLAQTQLTTQGATLLTLPDGILERVENATVTADQDELQIQREDNAKPVKMLFTHCLGLGISREDSQWWVLPIGATDVESKLEMHANHGLWVLPVEAQDKTQSSSGLAAQAWYIEPQDGEISATRIDGGLAVVFTGNKATLRKSEARPHSDVFGNRFSFTFADGPQLADALAGFYWGTMLPSVVEKTMAVGWKYSSGYVLSTLNTKAYAGSYPAVDHEFQTKGRLAFGSDLDLDIVRRMIGLQFQLMRNDPEGLFRAPCSVQPDGHREYHIRRNSKNNRENAAMFPVTGNIEVLEESWRYYAATKDRKWLEQNIENLEHAAGWTLAHVDQYGRLWGDVYYEDQVIKDGRETQIQGFAANTFALLARMERVLARKQQVDVYDGISKKMAHVMVEPLPVGYWDETKQRFIDWVDRNGEVHDHTHLVANTLPVTLGYASAVQAAAVQRLVEANAAQFERFPSFLAVDIAGYTPSEIGSGGPYDLSAAGRYWYWDAAYREAMGDGDLLLKQLKAVAVEGAKDHYLMGERYDMDYVYYIDGKNAHGAEKYYEYPNVYTAVLIEKWLGLSVPEDADLRVAPRIAEYGSVEFQTPQYAVSYAYAQDGFVLRNLAGKTRRFAVDLSGLGLSAMDGGKRHYRLQGKAGDAKRTVVTLKAGEEARWTVQ